MADNEDKNLITTNDATPKRRGRPPKLDLMRELAQELAYEPVDIRSDGTAMSRLESIIRDWFASDEFRKQKAVMELAYGKIPRYKADPPEPSTFIMDWDGEYDWLRDEVEPD